MNLYTFYTQCNCVRNPRVNVYSKVVSTLKFDSKRLLYRKLRVRRIRLAVRSRTSGTEKNKRLK